MKRFGEVGGRVRVVSPHLGLRGWPGRVVKVGFGGVSARVMLDARLPPELHWLATDRPRCRTIRVFPEECVAEAEEAVS